ncbi:MAG: DUF1844 domain-containing protein [Actinomycetota bacterium]|nr:DUF1844 domain-containing protein [Actinomycetota bacterium]MDQ3575399.1 DUF1844 domain-containing protein [Actinomycetota bacterium]
MSTIWTPGGEQPVGDPRGPGQGAQPARSPGTAGQEPATEEELEARMVELRQQLADTPVELVVANHCFGLFELAALHLSLQPPRLDRARLAIDALAALLEAMTGRLGDEEAQLQEGLASLRLAYVQIQGAQGTAGDADAVSDPGAAGESPV